MLKWFDNYFEETLMTILLVLITSITTYSVIMRYVLNNAPSWAEEITRFFFIWSAFLSIGHCIKRQSSIRIDILLTSLSKKNGAILQLFVNLFLIAVFAYWLNGALKVTKTLIDNGQSSPALLIPMWKVYGASVVGFSLGLIRCAQQIAVNYLAIRSGR